MKQIIKTPVFVCGSKRTAALVVLLFLQENWYQPMDEDYNEVAPTFILEMVQSDNSEETMKLIAKWLSNHFTQSK